MIISGAVRVGLKAKCWKSRLRSTALVLAALGIAGFAASAGATSISGPCAMLTNVTVATSGTATAAPGNIDANGTVVTASTTGAGSAHSQALISFEIVACGPAGATAFTPVPIDVIANGVTSGTKGSTDLGRVQTAVAFVGLEFTAGGGTTGSPGGFGSGLRRTGLQCPDELSRPHWLRTANAGIRWWNGSRGPAKFFRERADGNERIDVWRSRNRDGAIRRGGGGSRFGVYGGVRYANQCGSAVLGNVSEP
jgi:hypothetical protein